ncbi:helix-turn-helix domain-containing protein [Cellulomonas sp. NPDC058312]|uniref:helix-turn-helix domain-containing protein n=1 Tax=Cellulomonas sp. NPDC058312 TaxID=3346441 RepID=UPI0036EDC089
MGEKPAELGRVLLQARKLQGHSLQTIAERAEISAAYLAKLERDAVQSPSPHVLHRLSGALGLGYLDLMRAAGYVVPDSSAPSAVGDANAALRADDLTPAELDALSQFMDFLRKQRHN